MSYEVMALTSVSSLLSEATARLTEIGVENPRMDARLLLAYVLEVEPQFLVLEEKIVLTAEQQEAFTVLVERRMCREPVSRILKRRGFWTLDLCLNDETFDPRPDTEILVEAVLSWTTNRLLPYRILDLGAGAGGLLLALLSELPNATGIGIDIAHGAVTAAQNNTLTANLTVRAKFQVGDWGTGLKETFDIIVANPPYIAESDLSTLAQEVVRFDPYSALVGGSDGLVAYRALAPYFSRLLSQTGVVALEIGDGQAKAVEKILTEVGLALLRCHADLAGVMRCMLFQWPS